MTTEPAPLVPGDATEVATRARYLGWACAGAQIAVQLAGTRSEPVRWPQRPVAADSGLRSFVSVQGSLTMFPIRSYGSEEQQQQWLPTMASGEVIGCFGLTEPDSGSDPASMRTTARRDGRDWILNGTKTWITNGSIADVAVVWAGTEDGIRGFIVPTGTPGFSEHEIHHKTSLRASTTGELVLSDVRLPADAVLPEAVGLHAPLSCLNEGRFGILFGAMGAARACFESALAYARERVQFGKPIAAFS